MTYLWIGWTAGEFGGIIGHNNIMAVQNIAVKLCGILQAQGQEGNNISNVLEKYVAITVMKNSVGWQQCLFLIPVYEIFGFCFNSNIAWNVLRSIKCNNYKFTEKRVLLDNSI